VRNYDEASGDGTGFVFQDLDPGSLADTIGWAVSTWYDRPAHIETMRRRAMRDDHSWDQAARAYVELYLAAYARRRGHPFPGMVSAARDDRDGPAAGAARRPASSRKEGVTPPGERRPRPRGARQSAIHRTLSIPSPPSRREVKVRRASSS
jgi:hypothetical protein